MPFIAKGQSETHNFTLVDTTFSSSLGLGEEWIAAIWRPTNLFTANSPDTASRPLIIMMPGQGQMGSANYSLLSQYGPMYWLARGWTGGVPLGNGMHYPIIITISAATNDYPNPQQFYPVLQYIIQHYHIKPGCVYGTGLSEGAFTTSGLIEFEDTIGNQKGMKLFNALAEFEGTPTTPYSAFPNTPTPYPNSIWADTPYFSTWATQYHGKYFYAEGNGSDNFRDGWHYANAMNNVSPKSAYFTYESDGGGAHCCWNDFYDTSTTWATPTGGTYVAPSQTGTDVMGNYQAGTNVYQWMLQQGDTTLVGSGGIPPTVTMGSNQNITLPTSSVGISGSAVANSPATSISSYLWTQYSGPNSASLSSTTATNITVSGLIAGTYKFQLTATDNLGNSASGLVQVQVNTAVIGCKVYYWDSTNVNIALTNTNFPNVNPCDTIYTDKCVTQAAYRSITIKLSAATKWKYSTVDSNRINLIFRNGTSGTILPFPGPGNMFANSIDASDNLLIKGLKMYDHTDPLFSSVMATGYLHHIKFLKDTLQNMSGLWGSGPISTSLPNFTGNNDTINCIYDLQFEKCLIDSINSDTIANQGGGLTSFWLGGLNKNQVLVKTTFDSCKFFYFPSPAPAPACIIHCQQCYYIDIRNDTIQNVGVLVNPTGHAATFYMQASTYYIHDNLFQDDFSNCVRAISQGTPPGMNTLFKLWDPTYDGVSRFWGNILDSGRKYPMIEAQKDTIGMTGLGYCQPMRSPRVWNNTMYRGGTGKGNQSYNVSVYDWYEVAYTNDTIELHNNTEIGPPSDTTSGNFCYPTYCYNLLTQPAGTTAIYDTSGNQFSKFTTLATSGLVDPVKFQPALGGILATSGVSTPAWLKTDFYGVAIPSSNPSVGAVQYNQNIPPPPNPSNTIQLFRRKRIKARS